MAKNLRKIVSMIIALAMCFSILATPAMAYDHGGQNNSSTEWYQVIVNGTTVASASGKAGDHTWLVQGVYSWDVSVSGTTMTWRAGKHSGTVNLAKYITIPDGYEIAEGGYTVEHKSVEGTNSQSANFDNAIITVNITVLYNETTGETIPVPDPSEPSEPSEPPKPAQTKVTVNHIYKTYDIHTGETVTDGTTSSTADAIEGHFYTAFAAPSYMGNAYEQQTDDSALTITVDADASQNVINIEYLRTIDTTPINYTPVLDIDKIAVPGDYKVGDTITWTITVKNVSAYTAYGVVVSDELTGESWTIASLAPGATESFTATLQNAAAGVIKNVVVASWTDNDEIPDEEEPNEIKETSDEEIVEVRELINRTPKLSVVKTAGKATYEAGETVTWTITVKNTGDCDAYNVAIVDELTGDSWTIDVLAPGAEESFTTSLENPAAGSLKNVVIVSWEDGDEIPDEEEPNEIKETSDEELVTIEEPAPVNPAPLLQIIKTSNKYLFTTGETITWYITVKNVSQFPAYNVVVTDELTNDYWHVGTLEPGASRTFTATTDTVTAGGITNVAVVTWTDGDDTPDNQEPNEIKRNSDDAPAIVEDPAPVVEFPVVPANDEVIIEEEDVPLAAAPKTGDISGILAAISLFSLGGMVVLNRKKDEE